MEVIEKLQDQHAGGRRLADDRGESNAGHTGEVRGERAVAVRLAGEIELGANGVGELPDPWPEREAQPESLCNRRDVEQQLDVGLEPAIDARSANLHGLSL